MDRPADVRGGHWPEHDEGVPSEPDAQVDVVVVGAGMGGATLGKRLVDAGFSVLFLEKGRSKVSFSEGADAIETPAGRLDAGLWPDRLEVSIDDTTRDLFMPLGCAAGGSTIQYAAVLERYERTDFEPCNGLEHPTGGWPVPWSQWTSYYAQAEQLFGVFRSGERGAGELDGRAGAPSASDASLVRDFRRLGWKPYRLHVARDARPSCTSCAASSIGCRGHGCARAIALDPAIATGRATLLPDSEVVRIEADDKRVTGIVYRRSGALRRASARIFVLAAGACHTPALLLRSRSASWPEGLANGSGLVGRNLMFHANEWFAVWPRRRQASPPGRTIGLRDLYVVDGIRLGSIQSTGFVTSFGNIYAFARQMFERSRFRRMRVALPVLKLVAYLGAKLVGRATTFVMLIEDFAHDHNRIMLDPDDPQRVRVIYRIPDELRARARLARRLIRKRMKGLRTLPLHVDVDLNLGHACGTCRFGIDPQTSVIDPDCRAHELDNLYIADASFMPSSGGANPSLTVAANALRVAEIIARRLNAANPDGVRADAARPA